jgi:capsular exopolysaccharide synthesis family protein
MSISLQGDDPIEVAGLVNAVKKFYMEEVVNFDTNKRVERHAKLKRLKEMYAGMLKERRDTLRRLAVNVGTNDPATMALQQQFALEHVQAVRHELLQVQSEKRKVEAQMKARRSTDSQDGAPSLSMNEAELNRLIDQHPEIVKLEDQVSHLRETFESESAHLASVARRGTRDPGLKPLRDRYRAAEKALLNRRKELRPAMLRQLQEGGSSEHGSQTDSNEHTLAILDELERSLTEKLASLEKDKRTNAATTLDLQDLQEEIAQMQTASADIAKEVESLNVELRDAPPRIRSIQDAVPPKTKDQKKKWMLLGLITFGSFFGGLFGIAFLELQTQKVDCADQVPSELGLRVVGALPIVPSRANRGGAISRSESEKDRRWQTLLLESIDATRTMLVHAARTQSHRVVMVASAIGGEGKTSLASHLATSLARSGLKTLLIDADLRSPSIHRVFDLPVGAGLSELLRAEVGVADVINDTAIEELKIVTAGNYDQQTIRVLTQGALGSLFGQLREQFDFVIVDSSPILPVADALSIAQQADAVLFSIFREVSRKTRVAAAVERLECLGVRILGAVVTGGDGGRYGDYYKSDSSYAYSRLPASATDSSEPRA